MGKKLKTAAPAPATLLVDLGVFLSLYNPEVSKKKITTNEMPLLTTAQLVRSRVETITHTCHLIVYFYKTEPTTVWKSDSIWIDGEQYGKLTTAENTSADLSREHTIYQALGNHPHITQCFGLEKDKTGDAIALRIERAKCDLRGFIEASIRPSTKQRLAMASALVEGVQYLHSCKVFWGDLSTRNTLVFDKMNLKLCDFASAALEGVYPEFGHHTYEVRYWPALPQDDIEQLSMYQKELFALGSAIYEITEWEKPYAKVDDNNIDQVLHSGQRPTISDWNCARDIIMRCWDFEYSLVRIVAEDLASLLKDLKTI